MTLATGTLEVEIHESEQTENVEGAFTIKEDLLEVRQNCVFPESPPLNICCERVSSMSKLVRVSAVAMRFVKKKTKGEKFESPNITAEE